MERALESAALPFKGNMPNGQLDSDEEFETNLRRELIEIALVNGVSDVETLRDILIATRSEVLNVDPLRGDQRISLVLRRNRLSSSSPSRWGHFGDTTKQRAPPSPIISASADSWLSRVTL